MIRPESQRTLDVHNYPVLSSLREHVLEPTAVYTVRDMSGIEKAEARIAARDGRRFSVQSRAT